MNHIKIGWAVLPLFLLTLFACTKNDDNPGTGNVQVSAGTWKITYLFDKQDKTADYAGYTFEFGDNGSLSASNGSQTWTGSWVTGSDDSANKFVIDFNGTLPSALSDLEEDWRIISIGADAMHFEHTSGGNGDTDVLKFTRI